MDLGFVLEILMLFLVSLNTCLDQLMVNINCGLRLKIDFHNQNELRCLTNQIVKLILINLRVVKIVIKS